MIEIVDAIREVHDTECYGIIYLSVKEYSFAQKCPWIVLLVDHFA